MMPIRFLSMLLLFALSQPLLAETRYVTDQFEITLRSGASTSNSILKMLKSGQPVKVIEDDIASKYTLVETPDGKQGYVLTRYLDNQPSARQRLAALQKRTEQLNKTIRELRDELKQYQTSQQSDNQTIGQLRRELQATQTELDNLKEATRDTVQVIEQNRTLQQRITRLESEKQLLEEENRAYKDSTAMDWFVRGAGVSLLAFFIGILVTRIRWRKRDSWGEFR
jgi:SH3 domain protein